MPKSNYEYRVYKRVCKATLDDLKNGKLEGFKVLSVDYIDENDTFSIQIKLEDYYLGYIIVDVDIFHNGKTFACDCVTPIGHDVKVSDHFGPRKAGTRWSDSGQKRPEYKRYRLRYDTIQSFFKSYLDLVNASMQLLEVLNTNNIIRTLERKLRYKMSIGNREYLQLYLTRLKSMDPMKPGDRIHDHVWSVPDNVTYIGVEQ